MNNLNSKILGLLLVCMAVSSSISAQNLLRNAKNTKGIEVTYETSRKGKVSPQLTVMTVSGTQVALKSIDKTATQPSSTDFVPPTSFNFIDYSTSTSYSKAELPDGKIISAATPFELGKGFSETGSGSILGLKCKIVRTSAHSNTFEVWYTTDIPFRGSPQTNIGVPDGLVLKIIRNGNLVQEATKIAPLKKELSLFPMSWGEIMDDADYQYALKQSGVITIPIFDRQSLCFNGAKLPDTLDDGIQYNAGGGTILLKKVKLPENVSNRNIFAEIAQYSEGDAYDRTGSIFVIPTDREQSFLDAIRDLKSVPAFKSEGNDYHGLVSTTSYTAPLELVRFFTGFGVRKFNNIKIKGQDWADSVVYKTEITALAEQLKGEVWIGAYIGNWDAKGHRLSLKLKYYPDDTRKTMTVVPLFNTVNYLEQAGQPYPVFMQHDPLTVNFTLKEPVKGSRLFYLTTGHGGWGGGDEFNQKPNTISLDGQKIITFIPWRDDCGTYRNFNPCSGNFYNGMSSSDLSRSNWCPGTVTNPEYIYLGDMEAGEHTITVEIPQGAPEGNSNSYWCVSGSLVY